MPGRDAQVPPPGIVRSRILICAVPGGHVGRLPPLALARQVEDKSTIACCLEGFSEVAGDTGQYIDAARLLGASKSLRDVIGVPVPPWDRARYDRNVVASRAQLGEEAFAGACAGGQAMGVEQAIHYAMEA